MINAALHLGVDCMIDIFSLEGLLAKTELLAVLHEVVRQGWHIAALKDVPNCSILTAV